MKHSDILKLENQYFNDVISWYTSYKYLLRPSYPEHSKEALELSKLQESTKQSEQMAKIKEYEAAIEQAKVEQKRIDYEERRKTLQVPFLIKMLSE